jgi:hypothetical protein
MDVYDAITAANKPWLSRWFLPKLTGKVWEYTWPTASMVVGGDLLTDWMGWGRFDQGPAYFAIPSMRPHFRRWEEGRQPAPVVQPEPVETQEDTISDEELQQIFNSANTNKNN